jgi:hypothetical protein
MVLRCSSRRSLRELTVKKTGDSAGHSNEIEGTEDENLDLSRREAISRIGKFAIYTSPALLAMLTGEAYAQAFTGAA